MIFYIFMSFYDLLYFSKFLQSQVLISWVRVYIWWFWFCVSLLPKLSLSSKQFILMLNPHPKHTKISKVIKTKRLENPFLIPTTRVTCSWLILEFWSSILLNSPHPDWWNHETRPIHEWRIENTSLATSIWTYSQLDKSYQDKRIQKHAFKKKKKKDMYFL